MGIVWYLIALIFLILGLAGCFISILPGPILSYLALLSLIPTDNCLSAATLSFFWRFDDSCYYSRFYHSVDRC